MKGGQVWSQRISSNLLDSAVPTVQPDTTDRTENSVNDSREPGTPRAKRETSTIGTPSTDSAPVSLDWPAIQAFWEAVRRMGLQAENPAAPLPLPAADHAPSNVSRNQPRAREAAMIAAIEPKAQAGDPVWAVSIMALGVLVPLCQECGKPLNEEEPRRRVVERNSFRS
jgi:hypothetical protein